MVNEYVFSFESKKEDLINQAMADVNISKMTSRMILIGLFFLLGFILLMLFAEILIYIMIDFPLEIVGVTLLAFIPLGLLFVFNIYGKKMVRYLIKMSIGNLYNQKNLKNVPGDTRITIDQHLIVVIDYFGEYRIPWRSIEEIRDCENMFIMKSKGINSINIPKRIFTDMKEADNFYNDIRTFLGSRIQDKKNG